MGKRLLFGLLKGLIIGAGLGAALHFGLGWTTTPGLLGYLLAMGGGATAGILAGKPPWRHQAWIEALLKAVAGLATGALVYWLASDYGAIGLPFEVAGVAAGTPWPELPLLYIPLVAALFGSLVELDNTGDDKAKKSSGGGSKAKKARVADLEEVEAFPEPFSEKAQRKRGD